MFRRSVISSDFMELCEASSGTHMTGSTISLRGIRMHQSLVVSVNLQPKRRACVLWIESPPFGLGTRGGAHGTQLGILGGQVLKGHQLEFLHGSLWFSKKERKSSGVRPHSTEALLFHTWWGHLWVAAVAELVTLEVFEGSFFFSVFS